MIAVELNERELFVWIMIGREEIAVRPSRVRRGERDVSRLSLRVSSAWSRESNSAVLKPSHSGRSVELKEIHLVLNSRPMLFRAGHSLESSELLL